MASLSYRKQLNIIKADVGRVASNLAKGLAEQAKTDLISANKQIVKNYYQAHDPHSYNRKYNLYNSIESHSVRKSSKTSGGKAGGKAYTASVIVGSSDMDDIYRISQDSIFDLMWNHGVRGLPHHGNDPLNKSYYNPITQTYHTYENEVWQNPYWSGKNDPYHNVFTTSIVIGGYITKNGIPHNVMTDLVLHWWQASGERTCNNLIKKIKK